MLFLCSVFSYYECAATAWPSGSWAEPLCQECHPILVPSHAIMPPYKCCLQGGILLEPSVSARPSFPGTGLFASRTLNLNLFEVFRPVILKIWSVDQQYLYHLRTWSHLNYIVWGQGLGTLSWTSPLLLILRKAHIWELQLLRADCMQLGLWSVFSHCCTL